MLIVVHRIKSVFLLIARNSVGAVSESGFDVVNFVAVVFEIQIKKTRSLQLSGSFLICSFSNLVSGYFAGIIPAK